MISPFIFAAKSSVGTSTLSAMLRIAESVLVPTLLLAFGTSALAAPGGQVPVFLESICNPLLKGEPIKISPQKFIEFLDQQTKSFRERSDRNRDFSIQRLGWYQLEPILNAPFPGLSILSRYSDLLQTLDRIVLTEPPRRTSILTALATFVRLNMRFEGLIQIIGGPTLDFVGQWAQDYRLPDDFRRQAAEAYNQINGGPTNLDPAKLVSSDQLRAANTISYLGRTRLDLSSPETRSIGIIERLIPSASDLEKLKLFNSLMDDEPIPIETLLAAVEQHKPRDENDLESFLVLVGFVRGKQLVMGEQTFQWPRNGARILISGGARLGERLKPFSTPLQEEIIRQLKMAIQIPGAVVAINL